MCTGGRLERVSESHNRVSSNVNSTVSSSTASIVSLPRGQYALKTVLSLVTCGVSALPTCIRILLMCICMCICVPICHMHALPHPYVRMCYTHISAEAHICARACLGEEFKGGAIGERDVLRDDVGQVVGQPAARHSLVAARALLDPRGDEARLALLGVAAAVGGDQPEHVRVGWLEPPETARAHRGGTLVHQPPRPAPCAVCRVQCAVCRVQ